NDALEEGLVDTLCRWKDLNGVIKSVSGKGRSKLPLELLSERTNIYQNWGHPPYIAVVYALGVCAMDQGIKARQLEKTLLNLAEDNTVKAIVFRVDSPGGDGMASDVVAEALKKCAEKKPVVVSQGQVAASGGYWISMYGDKIVAAPNTITGSIGVIGGWIYDRGFSDKLGMTSDYTKSGKHAELGFGVRFPLLGIQLPARNLTEEEQQKVESLIKRMYDQFVQKVAAGRDLPEDSVRQVAQGRIYSGVDGKENKLVDEIGGLFTAVEIARTLAGIGDDAKYQIKEISKYKGFFDTDFLSPVSVRQTLEDDPTIQFLRMMAERPGYPFPILRPGTYPTLD
ncbi:signal peptide peptidase SppA, partial [Candidatus Saccharibacteria bacterium]|nr:signal peptide peptidase SppA [Candidatus Saccharibacteria bacterium]NIV72997.1 signal peptide peptidase SppA [Calditrichia bacterium]NIW00267.1 signal peptide peptidase SppA [Candidatus Saccharibacteria bacterium]NIW80608.1 signal peptide peptidase SppA [Calditrichia bacterium]